MRVAVALAVAISATAALASGATPSPQSAEKCRALLVYRTVVYYGLEGSHLALRAGRPAGTALEPECIDVPSCRPNCEPPKRVEVRVRRIVGVRPRVAITRQDVPNLIYVAADRCRGKTAPRALVRCLKRS